MKVRVRSMIAIGLAAALVAACATRSAEVEAAYVSPLTYARYDCQQLRDELERVGTRARVVAGSQNRQAQNDQIATGLGLFVFWPALFLLIGADRKEELANLKGQYDALMVAAGDKRCNVGEPRDDEGRGQGSKKPKAVA